MQKQWDNLDPPAIQPQREARAPTVNMIVPGPVNGVGVPATIVGSAEDDILVVGVAVAVDGGAAVSAECLTAGWGSWRATVAFPTVGAHTVVATATDHVGKVGTATLHLDVLDVTGPVLGNIVAPKDGVVGDQVGVVEFDAVDTESAVVAAWAVRDDGLRTDARPTGAPNRWRVAIPMFGVTVPAGGQPVPAALHALNSAGQEGTPINCPLTARDTTPPQLSFTPADEAQVPGTLDGADVTVSITASDDSPQRLGSGIAAVVVHLDKGPELSATPGPVDGTWTATVRVPADDQHGIRVVARDAQGNETEDTHIVAVALATDFRDLSRRTYLDDLLSFAGLNLLTGPDGHRVTVPILAEVLGQPLAQLATGSGAAAAVPVLRIVTEALRRYLDVAPPVPYAAWLFDEGMGDRARVTGLPGADGTIEGATWTPGPAAAPALHFDGAGARVFVGDTGRLEMRRAVTMSARVRPTGPGGEPDEGGIILCKEGSYALARFPDETLRFALAPSVGPDWGFTNSEVVLPTNGWSYVAVVVGDGEVRTYLNGVLRNVIPRDDTIGDVDATQQQFIIGARQWGGHPQHFDGDIAEVRLFDRVLTPWEIATLADSRALDEEVWVDEGVPPGATERNDGEGWTWVDDSSTPSSTRCHVTDAGAALQRHGVQYEPPSPGWPVERGDILYTDVKLDPDTPPSTLVLDILDHDREEHRVSWGEQLAPAWTPLGELPETGRWVRLSVPLRRLGLERAVLRGVMYGAVGGKVSWDRTGRLAWPQRPEFLALPGRAYRALLREIGTSYDELRLTKTAAQPDRQALADRLGITLGPNRPDELDALQRPLDAVRAEDLTTLFGYGAPPSAPETLVPTWRRARLRERWRLADTELSAADTLPIVDPDLVTDADVAPTAAAVATLHTEREGWIADQLGTLRSIRRGFPTSSAAYAAVVAAALAGIDLDALDARRRAGENVDADLAASGLRLDGFLRLRQVGAFAAADGEVLPEEWDDVDAVLVQVLKRRRYPVWRQEEAAAGIVLEPAQFVVVPAGPAELPRWRATWLDRRQWQERLQARRDQLAAVEAGASAAVSAAEQECLPDLRDALVLAVAGEADPADVATGLSQLLHLEVAAGGTVLVDPIDQAVQSLQSLIFGARMRTLDGELRGGLVSPAGDWRLAIRPTHSEADFDVEWQWMGSHATWRGAMSGFYNPENLLLAGLRTDLTPAFQLFQKALDEAVPVTVATVRKAVAAFATATDVAGLQWPAGVSDADRAVVFDLRPLADAELGPRHDAQARVLAGANLTAWSAASAWLRETLLLVPLEAAVTLQRAGDFAAALDWYRLVYAADAAPERREVFAGFALDRDVPGEGFDRTAQWLLNSLNPHDIAAARPGVVQRAVLAQVASGLLDFADAEFTLDTPESAPRARSLYLLAEEVLSDLRLDPPPTPVRPPNPMPALLRLRCAVNLTKLRNGLNIAGMPRSADPPPADDGQVVLVVGPNGLVPPAASSAPSPYRFATLVARAQQLVAAAAQAEAAYLASLEKHDQKSYSLLKARQDLEITRSRVDLQVALVDVAEQEQQLTELQRQRAQRQRDTYDRWIREGPSAAERAQRDSYEQAGFLRSVITDMDTATSIAQTTMQVASSQLFEKPLAVAAGIAFGAVALGRNVTQKAQSAVETASQVNALEASWQRRSADWMLARNNADADVTLARAQGKVATRRTEIARSEAGIATLQQTHAQAAADFLATEFTGPKLYRWMAGVLGDVYAALLRQATAVARTAERQLAFERQDAPPALIKADYWTVTDAAPSAEPAPDRRGLTGSARLLRDLTTLEQYAFDSNKRKLQLGHTVSLARHAPLAMQEFRRTGVLPFSITPEQLDACFPGTYLRLIRQVKTTVVGLLPREGVRATLTSSGVSRAVAAGPGGFRTVTIRRSPETIALTSPIGASGAFELDAQPELLMFFEGTGMDTWWEFRMPWAANPTLPDVADVIISFEYTALYDRTYADQVVRALPRDVDAQRVYSLRDDFPNAWFDLVNAAEGTGPLLAVFDGARSDFPRQLTGLATQALALHVVGPRPGPDPVEPQELVVTALTRAAGRTSVSLGSARTSGGVISTLTGTGANWAAGTGPGNDPVARWEVALDDDPGVRAALVDGRIADLVLAVAFRGTLPPWPE